MSVRQAKSTLKTAEKLMKTTIYYIEIILWPINS